MENKKIVMIEWTDVASIDLGLFSDEDIKGGIDSPKVIIVGILVKEDNECYYIAKEMWETEQYKYLHLVPKKYVDKLNVIGTTPFKNRESQSD
jgi:hypothetical protein